MVRTLADVLAEAKVELDALPEHVREQIERNRELRIFEDFRDSGRTFRQRVVYPPRHETIVVPPIAPKIELTYNGSGDVPVGFTFRMTGDPGVAGLYRVVESAGNSKIRAQRIDD